MESIEISGIDFQLVKAQTLLVGTDKGGWIYSSQRPRHEVRLPDFYIMNRPLTEDDIALLTGSKGNGSESLFNVEVETLKRIMQAGNDALQQGIKGLDADTRWEVRCPTESEWRCAEAAFGLALGKKQIEILADAVNSNYRGAMMDGRPRRFEGIGPMALHRAAIETHPNKEGITALSSVPLDRPVGGVVARLVLSPIREGAEVKVPASADMAANIRMELMCTLLLGVIPSFAIPILRGMGDYAFTGWANLLFGGLCAGFVTGAFWRPRRPTIAFDDVKSKSS